MLKFAEFCIALFFIFFLFFPEAEGLFFFFLPLPPLYFTVSCVVKVQFITDGELSFLAQVYVHSAVTRFVSFFFNVCFTEWRSAFRATEQALLMLMCGEKCK